MKLDFDKLREICRTECPLTGTSLYKGKIVPKYCHHNCRATHSYLTDLARKVGIENVQLRTSDPTSRD
jgi:hypothetical protein